MDRIKKKLHRRAKIKKGIKKKVRGTSERPRLSIYRSNTAIYAQIIDDEKGITLAAAFSKEVDSKSTPIDLAKSVGKILAAKAIRENITSVVFDRNGYLFHGRVKSLAEGAREEGLNF